MYLKLFAICCMLLLHLTTGFAQEHPKKVVVHGKTLDNDAVRALQEVQPGFSIYGDSAAIAETVLKYYTLNKYLAEKAKSAGIDTATQLHQRITFAKQVLEEKMLAEEYTKYLLENITVTEEEGLTYYKQHLSQFSNPGKRDFFYVQTNDTSVKTINAIKKIVNDKNTDLAGRGDTKVSNETYFITYSSYFTNNKNVPFFNEIMSAGLNTWSGPYSSAGTNGYFYFFVTNEMKESYTPYETVKEVCMQNVRSAKAATLTEQWNAEAQKMYPVKVTPGTEIFAPGKK